jgi:small subunit ribosomal protein S9
MTLNTEKKIISGKRKTAIAKLRIEKGSGKVFFNHLPHQELTLFHRLALSEPVKIYEKELGKLEYDLFIVTCGGGKESQIQAARLAIAKALVQVSGSDILKKSYIAYDRNMLVADARRKEANKPNDSAPRAKRQKSYR